jgi:hypothetical protein
MADDKIKNVSMDEPIIVLNKMNKWFGDFHVSETSIWKWNSRRWW